MRRAPLLLLLPLLCLAACGECNTGKTSWSELDAASLTAAQQKQRAKALGARDALGTQLSKRLMEALGNGGAGAAIEVCRDAAPSLAEEVSKAHGVTIGRTSHKLRSPSNAAPAWAASYVASEAADGVLLAAKDGRMAALFPISLQQACLACHGEPSKFAAPVKDALAAHYPEDEATGFSRGDVRGWFWVEVPSE